MRVEVEPQPEAREVIQAKNDLLTCALTPLTPVGARLSDFRQAWERVTTDKWILNIIRKGYLPEFTSHLRPRLSVNPERFESARSPLKSIQLQDCVDKLLEKRAIVRVKAISPSLYSNVFIVPKKNGQFRLVINLRELNQLLLIPRFKMESPASLMRTLKQGEWATSIDLSDAYLHVPMRESFQHLLRFVVNGKVYQYRSLPFGLSTAPLVFTKICQPLAETLHGNGIAFHRYLDDWLIRASSSQLCSSNTLQVLELTEKLGFLVNHQKSALIPSQDFVYVGIRFRLDIGIILPPPDHVLKTVNLAKTISQQSLTSAELWRSFLGVLGSIESKIPCGRRHLRPLQYHLKEFFRPAYDDPNILVPLSQEILEHLLWWTHPENLEQGKPLVSGKSVDTVVTDASLTAYWGHWRDETFSGVWRKDQKILSINLLELTTIWLALRHWSNLFQEKEITELMILSDNMTAIAYVKNQGGTHSSTLNTMAMQILDWSIEQGIQVSARHIPGRLNCRADLLSRRETVQTEWMLNPSIFRRINRIWGIPALDLMATRENTQLRLFVSPVPDDRALAIDGLAFNLVGWEVYVYPPTPIIQRLLLRLDQPGTLATVIIPKWENQAWFPDLLKLLIDVPLQLPDIPSLLRRPGSSQYHPTPSLFKLHACRLSGDLSRREAFHKRLETWSQNLLDGLHVRSTTLVGRSSVFGVLGGNVIPAELLR